MDKSERLDREFLSKFVIARWFPTKSKSLKTPDQENLEDEYLFTYKSKKFIFHLHEPCSFVKDHHCFTCQNLLTSPIIFQSDEGDSKSFCFVCFPFEEIEKDTIKKIT
ncbi:MAG: hypothetical protein AABY22_10330 [Nanoarchaeota archaeon]